jgi:hypothetical protein
MSSLAVCACDEAREHLRKYAEKPGCVGLLTHCYLCDRVWCWGERLPHWGTQPDTKYSLWQTRAV